MVDGEGLEFTPLLFSWDGLSKIMSTPSTTTSTQHSAMDNTGTTMDTGPNINVTEASDSAPSSIDVISTVGTWVAAALAIIALVGIVGPFLAIQAAKGDKNR